ncbi:hypothetical protein ACJQWK_02399 [Exserohilum turcicum]|uniref:Uncharacterized protein n=1 Tax=Exserohilum turcicum (strain 28A) TaxID=671987 RepID=R0KKC8_EXST2|nr:uncharacterized protein SETTUDRAFT_167434 [Exserohilum turcica Et28A]EOA89579.1 hypothetical protein SETTUDRAFT_167434 [Exserohilum turcica Et28A]
MLGRWTHRPASCVSPARRRPLRLPRCASSTHAPGRILQGAHLGPTRDDDDYHTVRLRQDKQAKELPLPPLLDPLVLEQRSRFEQKKERPQVADFTPTQRRLWENPFAHALASPVRQCRATFISLPVAFLTSLHPRPHPTTQDPWLLPVALTTARKHLGPPYRFLGRHLVTAYLGKKKAWEKGLYSRMSEKLGAHNMKNLVWREDMHDFILEMLRKKLSNSLGWYFGFRGRLIPVPSPRTEDIEHVQDVSSVLIFRSLRTRADDLQNQAEENMKELEKWSNYFAKNFASRLDPHTAPGVTHTSPHWYSGPIVPRLQPRAQFPELEFHATTWRGKKVAVYSLTDLLGAEKAQELVDGSRYAEANCVVLKRGRHNVPVEILLMQLQAYIARPGP